MTTYSATALGPNEPSSDPINDSDDELFNPSFRAHETVETVPLPRPTYDSSDNDEHETVVTLPLQRPGSTQQQPGETLSGRVTQPTQIIPRSPVRPGSNAAMPSSSPTSESLVQVTASSPMATPSAPQFKARPGGFLANAMAPAGTSFRRPMFNPPAKINKPIVIDDDDNPTYKGGSSDEEDLRNNQIKTTVFQRTSDSGFVPESPAKNDVNNTHFSSFVRGFTHDHAAPPKVNGVKRSAPADGDMAASYGASSKRSRSLIARAKDVRERQPSPDIEIDDITDANDRRKVREMHKVISDVRIKSLYATLKARKGNTDDAIDAILAQKEKHEAQDTKGPIDLTGSDDELMTTPAVQKGTKQQAKNPHKSIADKWSSTQQPRDQAKQLDAFSPPKPAPKKGRRLVRGRKDRSSPDLPDITEEQVQSQSRIGKMIVIDEDDDDNAVSEDEAPKSRNETFEQRLLKFFNTCSAADLADTASIKPALAQYFVSQQPYRSVAAVQKVDDPERKPVKGKGKRTPIGEKVWDTVQEMITAYEAVDYLVKECEAIAKPLAKEMRTWGVNTVGAGAGELEMTSISQSPAHDSGIGTPTDDEKVARPKSYISQPAIMNFEYQLNDYQLVGMNWLNLLYKHGLSCILADDMGLGKTYQVIAFLSHLYQIGEKGPHLIVVPSATLENWLMEFKKFSPLLRVEPYYAPNPKERAEMRFQIDNSSDISVVVTTYTIAKGKEDAPWLREFGFTCTVFDEGHYLKNAESLVARSLSRIQTDFRVLLTGTPLQNNLKELMSLLGFMMPELFNEKADELQAIFTHNVKTMDENHEALLSAQRIARARSMLTPFILRRKKNQVAKNLPPKLRSVEWCDVSPEQAEIYQFWHDKALSIRARREAGEECGNDTTAILMKLRQAAIHPFLFRRHYKDKMLPKIARSCLKDEQWALSSPDLIVTELEHYSDMEVHSLCSKNAVLNKYALRNDEWLASGKVQKMLELLRRFMAEGSRTLIFSQFVMVLDILELVLENERIQYFRLDGNTKVSERQDLINTFSEEGNETPVFMLSTKAGGAGINLAAANKVIVFDSGFNPQDDVQAENRAHRIGQVKPVEVVRLVTRNTVEEAIYKMGLTKVELDQRVAGSGLETPPGEVEVSEGKPETAAEEQGRQAVTKLFFENLDEKPIQAKIEPADNSQETKQTNEVEAEDLSQPSSPIKGGQEVKAEDVDLPARPKRKTAAMSSQTSSTAASRTSRSRSRK
ncbi:uncharacterized protein HMPREF1541_08318 [Cyphellophora europaea CBS 101466]|uniref:Uncharacterized protein n=1 Tax=Cyphellophora europaea (strain CBS 101466) TaxID=1220924 RepID=W2RLH1_CYPE1|nr:uncharacterized protein HMPREF1541_08318 [Cyphellophora europaea CBS 101466]ETN37327.1 hypothetical protein HMPREF1541_08318 [Cyphellophora europaea CBS 101466]